MSARPLWTAAEAAMATGGEAHGDFAATGVSIDTRTLAQGDLFVALTVARDAHDFVAQAFAQGAAAAMVTHRPEGVAPDAPLLIVPDVLAALDALGAAARARSRARVIGVTGSVGKTSTKEMLRVVLSGQGSTHASEASYNNQWGVPLTLARMPEHSEFAVIEIGMSNPGEIAPLARLTRPDTALITTIAPAHLAAFDSLDGIALEKASIFEGLVTGGTALVPTDLPTSPILRKLAQARAGRVIGFGAGPDADWRLLRADRVHDVTVATALTPCGEILFKVASPGMHFAMNALAVLAAADALGADLAIASADLGAWTPPDGRGALVRIRLDLADPEVSFELIDDAFNANPVSLGASLDVLAAAQPRDGLGRIAKGRRIAILGDMLELGPEEQAMHAALATHPAMRSVTLVHCVGPRMRALWDALPASRRGEWAADADTLAARAAHLADAGDVVLVKGSKGSAVSRVVDVLRKLGHGQGPAHAGDG